MGVPAFFRWLTTICPTIIRPCAEYPDQDEVNPETKPADYINPDIDNLYLDMNGIIHPCSHPQGVTVTEIPF
jgi:5'-3' exoribonuclease 2